MHIQVRSERMAGNLARARKASRSAYTWAKMASVVGMTIYITVLILFSLGALITVLGFVIGLIILCICLC